jgi:hypothetical protein
VDSQGKMITSYENFAKTNTLGSDITLSYSPFSWLTLRPSLNMSNLSYDGTLLNKQVKYDAFNWRTVFFSTVTFSSNTSVQLIVVYLGKMTQPQMDIKPTTFLIASLRQMLFDKKITLTVSAQNLFNLAKFNVSNVSESYRNIFLIKPESNIINLTLTYNFNNFKDLAHKAEKVDLGVSQGIQ